MISEGFPHPFERALSVPVEHIEFFLAGVDTIPWADYLLNPRRLRGSDFLMRWSQGAWSEERLKQAVNATGTYFALPYGPSGTAPDNDVRAFELYFERLEAAGLGRLKRPDLLVFRASERALIEGIVADLKGTSELPFTSEDDPAMKKLLERAVIAVECENSLWRASMMPDFLTPLSKQRRLGGRLGLKKAAVLPTIIIKEEDRGPLLEWQQRQSVPIHIWHAFFDRAYGISLKRAEQLIQDGSIEPTNQTFQAPGGATSAKTIYKIYYLYAYPLAETMEEPTLVADSITDKNGHILPYVRFDGGRAVLLPEAVAVLESS